MHNRALDFHEYLVSLLDVQAGDRILDAGCGSGATLRHIADRVTGKGRVVGVDGDEKSLGACRDTLGESNVELVVHDLSLPMPFGDGTFSKIVCHNVVECLLDKRAFLADCYRVLSPGGILVLSHSDFDTMVFNSTIVDLTRRLVHCYADWKQAWMATSDPMMGRKLAGLVGASAFAIDRLDAYSLISMELVETSPGGVFLAGVLAGARKSGGFAADDLTNWEREQRDIAKRGEFFFAVTNFIVVGIK